MYLPQRLQVFTARDEYVLSVFVQLVFLTDRLDSRGRLVDADFRIQVFSFRQRSDLADERYNDPFFERR